MWRMTNPPSTVMAAEAQSRSTPIRRVQRMLIMVGLTKKSAMPRTTGKRAQNPSSEPSLRCMCPDLPLQAEPFPDHIRSLVEYFGQVAAALLLNHDRGGHDSQILQRHPLNQIFDRGLELKTVVLFLKTCFEFTTHRVRAFPAHQPHGGNQAVPGPQPAYHQVQRLRQALLQTCQSACCV